MKYKYCGIYQDKDIRTEEEITKVYLQVIPGASSTLGLLRLVEGDGRPLATLLAINNSGIDRYGCVNRDLAASLGIPLDNENKVKIYR